MPEDKLDEFYKDAEESLIKLEHEPAPSHEKSSLWKIIAVIVSAVFILGIVGIYYYYGLIF